MKKMYTIFILLLGVFNLSCSESKTGTYSENKTEKNIFNTIVDTISGAKFEYNVAESTPDTFNLVHLFLPESYDAQLLNDKHPENIRNYEAADIFDLLFEGLVRIDENGKIVPGLAEKWETDKDKTKWTFHLRKGLKYSDGTPIKAEDFKTALLRMLNPEIISPNTDVLFLIKNGREFYEGKVKNRKERISNYLKDVNLYNEVKNDFKMSALKLSGGQKQRLCIARMLTTDPDILIFDEPCSSLDMENTLIIEKLIKRLSEKYTVILTTHNEEQAKRIADRTILIGK